MNLRVLKTVAILLGVVILILLAVFLLLLLRSRRSVTDGPGTVYDLRTMELAGDWAQVGGKGRLHLTGDVVKYTDIWGRNGYADYTPSDTGCPAPDAEVTLDFPNRDGPFEYMLFHFEELNGQRAGVLSGVIFEYDGRGPVIFAEFLRSDSGVEMPPADWESALAERYNSVTPVSTVAE